MDASFTCEHCGASVRCNQYGCPTVYHDCPESKAAHQEKRVEAPAGFEERGSPLAEGFTAAIKLLGLVDEVERLADARAEEFERDELLKIGTALRGLSKATIDERALAWERGRRHGAEEERERIGRQLETACEKLSAEEARWSLSAADLRQRLAEATEEQAETHARWSELRAALVVVRGAKGPTRGEG